MASRTVKVVGAVVVIVIIVAVIAAAVIVSDDDSSDSSSSSSTENQVRYNYSIELTDSYTDKYGLTEKAASGSQYAALTVTLANDGYADGVHSEYTWWNTTLRIGGVDYTPSWYDTYGWPTYSGFTIPEGSTASIVLVYEIPDTAGVYDILVYMSYNLPIGTPPTFVFDAHLRFRACKPLPKPLTFF